MKINIIIIIIIVATKANKHTTTQIFGLLGLDI
jgi:hypothetical protein